MDAQFPTPDVITARNAYETYLDGRIYSHKVTREVYEIATLILENFDYKTHDFIALGRSPVLVMAALKALTADEANITNLPLSLRHEDKSPCDENDVSHHNILNFQHYLRLFTPVYDTENTNTTRPIVLIDFVTTASSLLTSQLFIKYLTGREVFCVAFGHRVSKAFMEARFDNMPYIFISDAVIEGGGISTNEQGQTTTGLHNSSSMLNQLSDSTKRHALFPSYKLFDGLNPRFKPEISGKWIRYLNFFRTQIIHLTPADKPGVFSITSRNTRSFSVQADVESS